MLNRTVFCAVCLASFCFASFADEGTCLRCHKRNGNMEGVHGHLVSDVGCVRCHGDMDAHPRDKESGIRFGLTARTPVAEQNAICLECHGVARLRKADWTHDVHASRLACAACHALHPKADPMLGLKPVSRTQLCVDCHQPTENAEVRL